MKTPRPTGAAVLLAAVLAGWALLAPAASAIRPDPSPQDAVRLPKPLQHDVRVTLKLVQVYVTDKQDKPVRDLAKEDFAVTDNGRIMALTEFEKHVLEAAFELPDYVLITDYETMFKELSAANCSIFSFDSREAAKVPTLFDYDEQTFGSRGSRDMFSQGGVQQNSNLVFKDENVTGLYSLSKLANATGGKYFGNINEYERNLDQLQNLTGSYYVLGYSIGEQWDGKFHEIKVELKRKGCEVRAQAGYFNPKPFAEYSDLEKQLHLFDLALSDRPLLQTPAVFAMGALSYASGEEPRLLMLSKIPTAVLDKFSGKKVEIVAIVFDDKDNVAGLQRREADLSKYRGMDVFFTSGAALAPGNYRCRIVIRDLASGTAAVASSPARVAKPATVGLSLHTPLLLVAESNFAYLEAAPSKTRDKLGWAEAYPFDRSRYSPLVAAAPAGTAKIYAALPCFVTGLVAPDIALAVHLVRTTTGESIALPFTVLAKTDLAGAEIRFLEIPLAGVPSGKYRLYLHAEDAASKAMSYAQTFLTLTSDAPLR